MDSASFQWKYSVKINKILFSFLFIAWGLWIKWQRLNTHHTLCMYLCCTTYCIAYIKQCLLTVIYKVHWTPHVWLGLTCCNHSNNNCMCVTQTQYFSLNLVSLGSVRMTVWYGPGSVTTLSDSVRFGQKYAARATLYFPGQDFSIRNDLSRRQRRHNFLLVFSW